MYFNRYPCNMQGIWIVLVADDHKLFCGSEDLLQMSVSQFTGECREYSLQHLHLKWNQWHSVVRIKRGVSWSIMESLNIFTSSVIWGANAVKKKVPVLSSVSVSDCAEPHEELFNGHLWKNTPEFFFFIEDIPLCLNSKSSTECFKVTVKTQQQCTNVSILLWQHVSLLLSHLQVSILRYEVQSVHIMYCRIPYYLQGVNKK